MITTPALWVLLAVSGVAALILLDFMRRREKALREKTERGGIVALELAGSPPRTWER